jgi:hypothetical protein
VGQTLPIDAHARAPFISRKKFTLVHESAFVRERLSRAKLIRVEKKLANVDASRTLCAEKTCLFITLEEGKRAHPNMVLIHNQSQESLSIDLSEADVGGLVDLGPFFSGWIAFQNFLLARLELGRKKSWRRKKVRKQVERNGS